MYIITGDITHLIKKINSAACVVFISRVVCRGIEETASGNNRRSEVKGKRINNLLDAGATGSKTGEMMKRKESRQKRARHAPEVRTADRNGKI